MRKSVLAVVGIAIAIIIVGFIVKSQRGSTPSGTESASETNSSAPRAAKGNPKPPEPPNYTPGTSAVPERTNRVAPRPAPSGNFMTNWEEKLDTILTSDKPDPDKAKEMIEMFPKLSPEAQ